MTVRARVGDRRAASTFAQLGVGSAPLRVRARRQRGRSARRAVWARRAVRGLPLFLSGGGTQPGLVADERLSRHWFARPPPREPPRRLGPLSPAIALEVTAAAARRWDAPSSRDCVASGWAGAHPPPRCMSRPSPGRVGATTIQGESSGLRAGLGGTPRTVALACAVRNWRTGEASCEAGAAWGIGYRACRYQARVAGRFAVLGRDVPAASAGRAGRARYAELARALRTRSSRPCRSAESDRCVAVAPRTKSMRCSTRLINGRTRGCFIHEPVGQPPTPGRVRARARGESLHGRRRRQPCGVTEREAVRTSFNSFSMIVYVSFI
jgi:hypothetical protein